MPVVVREAAGPVVFTLSSAKDFFLAGDQSEMLHHGRQLLPAGHVGAQVAPAEA